MSGKKTPLEETFDLPSIEDLNKNFSKENIESAPDDDSDEHDDMKDYLKELEDADWDEDDIDDPETLKKQIAETQRKLREFEEQKRQLQSLKRYHSHVDNIHTTAMAKFDELMIVALSMEANAGSKYLASATKLLDIALNAKNSAMDREIEMAKLQLRKEKQDYDMKKANPKDIPYNDSPDAEHENDDGEKTDAVVYSRSELLNGHHLNDKGKK